MKQVLVRVSDEVHQKLKEKTVKEKTSVQEVMSKMICDYLCDDCEIEYNKEFKITKEQYDNLVKKWDKISSEMSSELIKVTDNLDDETI